MKHLTAARRRYLYRVTIALLGVAVVYGLVSGEQSSALLLLVAAVLGVADSHVSGD